MRVAAVTIFATLSALAAAQSLLGSFPKCVQDCFGSNYGTCNPVDFKCICGNQTLIGGLSCCVYQTCSPEEQDSIIKTAANLCKAYSVDLPTSASCASTASPTASGSSNSSSGSTAPVTPTPTPSEGAAGQGTSSPGAAAPIATAGLKAGAGLGLVVGVAGFLVGL